MARRSLRVAIVATALCVIVSAGPVAADYRESWSTSETISRSGMLYDTRVPDDTYRARTWMTFDSTRAGNMRHMATHGYRFTDDVHDMSCHLSATGRRETNFDNPDFDRDERSCSDGFYRYDEAEITAESNLFPTAGKSYWTNFYFMRWAHSQDALGLGLRLWLAVI